MLAIDEEAVAIGLLYSRAQTSTDDRLFYLGDAGNRLLKKKESLGHGRWLYWLKSNQSVLGFSERGARSLINGAQWLASNWQLANRLEEIVTDPRATEQDYAKAAEIRQLISCQFRPLRRGTLGHRPPHDEWYTPALEIERARCIFGGEIDLDPASSALAQETIKARHYFDKEQNGLRKPWYGRVWLNPPFSQPLIGQFIGKLLMEWNAERISACIALTHNNTDAMWFHDAASAANVVCFTYGRIKFHDGSERLSPAQGQAFFYFGSEIEAFTREFGRIGFIARPEPDSWTRRRVRDMMEANLESAN
jgi:ParB family chromosome partitioning protein